jgi:NitT/TauT family transport system ATP-binding protein
MPLGTSTKDPWAGAGGAVDALRGSESERALNVTQAEAPLVGERELVVDHVSHVFPDGTEVLRDVSLTVDAGEFVSLIGPSGCGKSTLLKIAAGLVTQSSGTVVAQRENIGFVFQDATLLPFRSVLKNVELFAELHKVPKGERRALAESAIEMVGLKGFEGKYPKALSGGMKMRASLARSLVLHPRLFLFDEPFAAVDEITRARLNDEVIKLFTAERFAGVFVTHSIPEACFLSTRVIVMSSRPASVLADIPIPFPYPRHQDLRYEDEFVEKSRQVAKLLGEA